jgi:enterochelin esterase family protein
MNEPITYFDFDGFLKDINSKSEIADRISAENFLRSYIADNPSPVLLSKTRAAIISFSRASKVYLTGDMTEWAKNVTMEHISDTQIHYYVGDYESDARLEYLIQPVDVDQPGPDPLNPFIVHNGFGPNSELAMPEYDRLKIFDPYLRGKKGDYKLLEEFKVDSRILGYEHDIITYLPPNYQHSSDTYPTVYIQDGRDYIEFAITPVVIDELIRSGQIEPIIAVFISPPNRHVPDQPNRMTEYGLNNDYVNFMADELVPFIESNFRATEIPQKRLVAGDSFGGLISAYTPHYRPDVFGSGYSQSGYQSFQGDQLIKLYETSEKKSIRLYVDIGTYEGTVGADMLPEDETDFLSANRRFKEVLAEKRYDFVYREFPEGHTWGNWRRHMIDGLVHFFGVKNIRQA